MPIAQSLEGKLPSPATGILALLILAGKVAPQKIRGAAAEYSRPMCPPALDSLFQFRCLSQGTGRFGGLSD